MPLSHDEVVDILIASGWGNVEQGDIPASVIAAAQAGRRSERPASYRAARRLECRMPYGEGSRGRLDAHAARMRARNARRVGRPLDWQQRTEGRLGNG